MNTLPKNKFPIGYKYIKRGKGNYTHTVIDHLTTTNIEGEITCFRYLVTHEILGQTVKSEAVHTTLLMSPKG